MESLADTLHEVRRALDEAVGVAFRWVTFGASTMHR